MKTFNVTPIGKPRMTQSDRWKKRDCVVRYFNFKDEIRRQMGDFVFPNAGQQYGLILQCQILGQKRKRVRWQASPINKSRTLTIWLRLYLMRFLTKIVKFITSNVESIGPLRVK